MVSAVFLNDDVKRKCQDLGLVQLWVFHYGYYDDEIEPLHNKEWVDSQKKEEEKKLDLLISNYENAGKIASTVK